MIHKVPMTVRLLVFITAVFLTDAKLATAPKFESYESHPCYRPCISSRPWNCYYDFTLEYYYTLNKACFDCPHNHTDCSRPHCIPADGVSRGLLVANRMLPGPAIHVCKGDQVIVKVANHLSGGEGTSIHWHGVHQYGSQHMDGVSMVTQCPIPTSSSFEYRFNADNSGTHFWHAHSGLQRIDGLYGAFVVREPAESEPHLGLYEEDRREHVIIVNDWLVEMGGERFAHHHHSDGDNKPKSMLINGKGVLQEFFDNSDNTTNYTPVEVYTVKLGRRYRFRTISNGIMNCPIQGSYTLREFFKCQPPDTENLVTGNGNVPSDKEPKVSIDNHTLTMIASDGNPFEKVDVESFNIFAGERYDFVLNASMPIGNYWVRVRGLADCGVKQANQVAILRYEGALEEDPSGSITWDNADRPGRKLNPWNAAATETYISVSQLTSVKADQKPFKEIPDKKFYLATDFNKIDNYHFHYTPYYSIVDVERKSHLYLPQINHISSKFPPSPPLSQHRDIPEELYCDAETMAENNTYCSTHYCECVYRLQVALGDEVELVMIDEGVTFNANHPFHLHGHSFHVVGLDKINTSTSIEEVKRLDKEGKLHRNLTHAVAKDTVTVPDGGYSILRFHANNPGFWLFHCHIQFHAEIGMALIIQVGGESDMPRTPKGFPTCGDWRFSPYDEDDIPTFDNDKCTNGATTWTFSILLYSFICLYQVWLNH